MSIRIRFARASFVAGIALLASTGTVRGADEGASPPKDGGAPATAQAAPSSEEIASLVRQLDANRFTERQAATQRLTEIGGPAVPALEKAAVAGPREVTLRAFDILKSLYENGDDDAKAAAKEAVERLATSEDASVARRAEQIVAPKPPQNAAGGFGIQLVPGQIQIRVQAVAGPNNRRVTTRIVNGVKEIDVEEGERKIKIHDDPNNGIKVEITQKKDGKEVTEKYEAKDADDLKKKHPDAHKIYEQYSQGGNAVQIRAVQIAPGNAPLPVNPAVPQLVPARDGLKEAAQRIEEARRQLDEAAGRLKRLAVDSPQADELKKAVEELEAARRALDEARQKLAP
jgi:hypothetical protein